MDDTDRIQNFLSSLSLAIYDKLIEIAGIKLVFFYDADVIIKLVVGFEYEQHEGYWETRNFRIRPGFEKQRVVRALLSLGYLGPFCLLRSHAFEFYEEIRRRPQYRTEEERKRYLERALNYIDAAGINQDMERLLGVVRSRKDDGEHTKDLLATRFLSILQEKSADNFALIEQLNGTWDQRLRRYYDEKLLRLDLLGPEAHELTLDHGKALTAISEVVRKERPDRPLNAFQDAAALTALSTFIKEWKSKQVDFVVRFNTETIKFEEAIHKPELTDYLSYNDIPDATKYFTPPASAHSIYRNSDYFIVRAMFEELSPIAEGVKPEDLAPLIELATQVEELLEEGPLVEAKLLNTSIRGQPLGSLLESFQKVSLMKPFWVEGATPQIISKTEALSNWLKVFEYAKENRTEALLHTQISDIRNELRRHVSKIRVWANDFRMVLKARNDRKEILDSMEDPMRDLGLVRWGYELTPSEKENVVNFINQLAGGEEAIWPNIANEIATAMEFARREVNYCRMVVAILWALGRYREVVDLIETCHHSHLQHAHAFPSSLLVMKFAALLKTGEIDSTERRREIIDQVSKLLSIALPEQRKGMLLGVGYVIYQAWKGEMLGVPQDMRQAEHQSDEIRDWAKRTFNIGQEAYHVFTKNTLPWAYAANHCAYVGVITGVEPDKTKEYLFILLDLKGLPALWNARFDDTVGTWYVLQAQRRWKSVEPEQRNELDILDDLKLAKEYLDRAKRMDPGDIDIPGHLFMLSSFSEEVNAFLKEKKRPLNSKQNNDNK